MSSSATNHTQSNHKDPSDSTTNFSRQFAWYPSSCFIILFNPRNTVNEPSWWKGVKQREEPYLGWLQAITKEHVVKWVERNS